jgi:hypothetical protein
MQGEDAGEIQEPGHDQHVDRRIGEVMDIGRLRPKSADEPEESDEGERRERDQSQLTCSAAQAPRLRSRKNVWEQQAANGDIVNGFPCREAARIAIGYDKHLVAALH